MAIGRCKLHRRLRTDNAIDTNAFAPLKLTDRKLGTVTVHTVGRDAEFGLQLLHGLAVRAQRQFAFILPLRLRFRCRL